MSQDHHICHWRCGSILTSGLRKLFHNPRRIIGAYFIPGITAMDIGCGMGYFTLPMSEMAGKQGKVIAVDLQTEMLAGLRQRAVQADCQNIILHPCGSDSLHIEHWAKTVDFALLFMVLHEVPDPERLIKELKDALAPGGRLLFAEPMFHVKGKEFQRSLTMIQQVGLSLISSPRVAICRAALLQKQ